MRYKLHIPFSSRTDLLLKAVESVRRIGNINLWYGGPAPLPELNIPDVTVHYHGLVSCVSLYNMCIHASWDDDVMFMAHNDMECNPEVAANFLRFAHDAWQSGDKWGLIIKHYDVLAAFNMKAIRDVGPWDTMYFQYHADVDYYKTLKAAGWRELDAGKPEEITHHGSSTVKSDPLYNWRVRFRTMSNFDMQYYVQKWGGPAHQERFTRPWQTFDPKNNYESLHRRRQNIGRPGGMRA